MKENTKSSEELMALERESFQRNVNRDLNWLKSIHAKNALMFNPGSKIQNAHNFFSERLETAPRATDKNSPKFSWEPTNAEVSASDDMGWVYGVITIDYPDGRKEFGKYVSVWIREDGQWKVTAEIRNLDS